MLKPIITRFVRKGVLNTVNAQGTGKQLPHERLERARKDIMAVEELIEDKDFLFGDQPTAADATAVPMLRAAGMYPVQNQLSDLVLSRPKLVSYVERGKAAMYPAFP